MQSAKLLKLAILVDIVKQVVSVTPARRVNSANIVKPVDNTDPRDLPDCVHRPCYGTADTYSWGDTNLIDWVIKTGNYKFCETWLVDF